MNAKRKMVVSFMHPTNTIFPVPAWKTSNRSGNRVPAAISHDFHITRKESIPLPFAICLTAKDLLGR